MVVLVYVALVLSHLRITTASLFPSQHADHQTRAEQFGSNSTNSEGKTEGGIPSFSFICPAFTGMRL